MADRLDDEGSKANEVVEGINGARHTALPIDTFVRKEKCDKTWAIGKSPGRRDGGSSLINT